MADVSKVPGPSGPQEAGRGRPATHAQKFKELMKVQKVDEVDEERKKKRKRSEETEAETKAEAEEALEGAAPKKPPTPLEIIPKGKKELVTGKPAKTTAPETEPAGETHFPDEEEFLEALPSKPVEKRETSTELRPPRPHDKKVEAAKAKGIAEYKEAVQRKTERAEIEAATAEKDKMRVQREEEKQVSQTHETKREKQEEVEEVTGAALLPNAQLTPLETKRKEEKKIEEAAERGFIFPQAPSPESMQVPTQAQPAPTAPAAYATLHPTVLDLFERMVGVMTVMTAAGITETTLTLSAPEYANSAFFGAQVIIKEFVTAPKAYNVQIVASPQGVALVQKNMSDLMSSFQAGNYNFKVNRLEALLSTERPLFRRKERVSGEEEEEGR